MRWGFTVVTAQEPDPAALGGMIADIEPGFVVSFDRENQVWRVFAEDGGSEVMLVETPQRVRGSAEMLRLFGTTAGLPAKSIGPRSRNWWQDVNVLGLSPRFDVAALLCKALAERGGGTCIARGSRFQYLGQPGVEPRREWA